MEEHQDSTDCLYSVSLLHRHNHVFKCRTLHSRFFSCTFFLVYYIIVLCVEHCVESLIDVPSSAELRELSFRVLNPFAESLLV